MDDWNPLTDWNATMEVAERMQALQSRNGDHWDLVFEWDGDRVIAGFWETQDDTGWSKDPNHRRAICLAALATLRTSDAGLLRNPLPGGKS